MTNTSALAEKNRRIKKLEAKLARAEEIVRAWETSDGGASGVENIAAAVSAYRSDSPPNTEGEKT